MLFAIIFQPVFGFAQFQIDTLSYQNGFKDVIEILGDTKKVVNYFPNGQKNKETIYHSIETDSVTYKYYKNDNLSFLYSYKNGKMNGLQAYWYDNGNQRSVSNYKNGVADGRFVSWYENGQKMFEIEWKDGKRHGLYESFYANGRREKVGNYYNDLEDGEFTTFWKNGKTKETKHYKLGGYIGTWLEYTRIGIVKNRTTYGGNIDLLQSQCNCVDSIQIPNFKKFNSDLNEIITRGKINIKRFKYHAPIGNFYNDIVFSHHQIHSHFTIPTIYETIEIYSRKPMTLHIPNKNGIKLTLNPCVIVKGNGYNSKMNISITHTPSRFYEIFFTPQYEITASPQYVSLDFNPKLLRQYDSVTTKRKNRPAAHLLLKTQSLFYDSDGIGIKLYNICSTPAEIGKSNILLDILFNDYLEFLRISDLEDTVFVSKIHKLTKNDFGLHIPETNIIFPKDFFNANQPIVCAANNIFISGNKIFGAIHIKSAYREKPCKERKRPKVKKSKHFDFPRKLWDKFATKKHASKCHRKANYYFIENNEKVYFSAKMIRRVMTNKGYEIITEYNNNEFIIYFKYE